VVVVVEIWVVAQIFRVTVPLLDIAVSKIRLLVRQIENAYGTQNGHIVSKRKQEIIVWI